MQELGVPIKGHVKKWLKQEHVSDWLALVIRMLLRNPPCFLKIYHKILGLEPLSNNRISP